ncbi:hypothetical protein WR25_23412 [Diploscapter pachys]|uniref:Abnormal cell migration protein 18-like fibronectin type I domain-containing protein n=1 Tax=Diploscapter pachys TaxID=2018661 RepID=A0A2A2JMP5_9BILA|nr:hypothetical protein WR25_23412 [Diploscapter pachys]
MLEMYLIRSLVSIVLLNFVEPLAVFDKNYTKPYVLKKSWVQNFIKFQYIFEGKQRKAKIVPLGCVPSNTENGKVLDIGERFHGHDFIFSCEQGEDGVLNYEAVACVDAFGVEMHPGETRRLSNGTVVLHCNIFGGALKKVVERTAGCYYNETIYGEEVTWVEPLSTEVFHRRRNTGVSKMRMYSDKGEDKLSAEGDNVSALMTGKLMQCFRPHYSYYESHVIGCVIGRLGLLIDQYAEVDDGSYVKCVESELGFVQLQTAKFDG